MQQDKLVHSIFESIKLQPASSPLERIRAIGRASTIAHAYLGENPELIESIFGKGDCEVTPLQHDVNHGVVSKGDGIH
jgi:hypothetical protein